MSPGYIILAGVIGVYLVYSGILPHLLALVQQAIAGPQPGSSPNVSTGPVPAGGGQQV